MIKIKTVQIGIERADVDKLIEIETLEYGGNN